MAGGPHPPIASQWAPPSPATKRGRGESQAAVAVTDGGGTPTIELRHIDKRFGEVHANRDVCLAVARGSITGIVGENGAGKSTLMSILYGFYEADGGEILIDGQPVHVRSPSD